MPSSSARLGSASSSGSSGSFSDSDSVCETAGENGMHVRTRSKKGRALHPQATVVIVFKRSGSDQQRQWSIQILVLFTPQKDMMRPHDKPSHDRTQNTNLENEAILHILCDGHRLGIVRHNRRGSRSRGGRGCRLFQQSNGKLERLRVLWQQLRLVLLLNGNKKKKETVRTLQLPTKNPRSEQTRVIFSSSFGFSASSFAAASAVRTVGSSDS
jgi:hypothetical protein